MASFILAHISDLHCVEPGATMAGCFDPTERIRAVVAQLNALDPAPAVILATGDLANTPTEGEYVHLAELLAPLTAPLVLLPGNHDDRVLLRRHFPHAANLTGTDDGYVTAARIGGDVGVALFGLDTQRHHELGGRLDGAQLAWLDASLAAAPNRPAIVALHHPPFATGIGHMDAIALDPADADALAHVIARHPQVERVLCGHVHRSILRRWAGTIVQVVPAVAPSLGLDIDPDATCTYTEEPPMIGLHWWDPAGGAVVSHLLAVGDYPRVVPPWVLEAQAASAADTPSH